MNAAHDYSLKICLLLTFFSKKVLLFLFVSDIINVADSFSGEMAELVEGARLEIVFALIA